MSSNSKRLIIIYEIGKIIEIFLGPFFTAYIFKISTNSITIVSLYNIFSYFIIAFLAVLLGIFIKNRNEMIVFRLGMISQFFQLLIVVFLGKRIVKYIWIAALISGLATITYYLPHNLFSSILVPNKEKKEYSVYKNMLTSLVRVVIPIVFGAIISENSFEKTAIIVLILSIIQILASFKLEYKKSHDKPKHFKLIENYKKLKKNKNVMELFKTTLYFGMTADGALKTSITLLIIIAFKKDFSLGIITSLIYILSIFSSYLCKKIIEIKKIKIAIYISGLIPLLSTIILLFITNKITIVGYNIIYAFFIQIITVIKEVKTLKITDSSTINDSNRTEVYVLIELFLGIGRIISYVLLLIVGLLNSILLLKILIIFLSLCILFSGIHLIKIDID